VSVVVVLVTLLAAGLVYHRWRTGPLGSGARGKGLAEFDGNAGPVPVPVSVVAGGGGASLAATRRPFGGGGGGEGGEIRDEVPKRLEPGTGGYEGSSGKEWFGKL